MFTPESIFDQYLTSENKPFFKLDKAIGLPPDKNNSLYSCVWCGENTAWTIVSYKLYDSIDYWYLLATINRHIYGADYQGVFYAPANSAVYYIKDPDMLNKVTMMITRNI